MSDSNMFLIIAQFIPEGSDADSRALCNCFLAWVNAGKVWLRTSMLSLDFIPWEVSFLGAL